MRFSLIGTRVEWVGEAERDVWSAGDVEKGINVGSIPMREFGGNSLFNNINIGDRYSINEPSLANQAI